MTGVGEVIIVLAVFLLTILIVAAPFVFVLLLIKIVSSSGKKNALDEEEVRMLNELYHGMKNMEQRIENMETILSISVEAER